MNNTEPLLKIIDEMNIALQKLNFSEPVTHVYNPQEYAREAVKEYIDRFGQGKKRAVFIGMNPGPFGMAQTGVPFGEVKIIKDWLQMTAPIGHPANEHPDRPIMGWDCHRNEVSGQRLWGLFKDQFTTPENFFNDHFVWNFCPLLFNEIGRKNNRKVCRNVTPDKIKKEETAPLYEICDKALVEFIDVLNPDILIGVGVFAENCLKRLFGKRENITIMRMLHPSPASPPANKDFKGKATKQLIEAGVWQ